MTDQIYTFVASKIIQLDIEGSHARALCAKLRRAVGKPPGATPEIWEITLMDTPEEWLSYDGTPTPAEWAVHTALTLYALHRQGKNRSMSQGLPFGAAIGQLGKDENKRPSIVRRFNSMATATEFTELAHHARGLVQLLKASDISMDYPRFATDLFWFQTSGGADKVRLRWGEDFYRAIRPERTDKK